MILDDLDFDGFSAFYLTELTELLVRCSPLRKKGAFVGSDTSNAAWSRFESSHQFRLKFAMWATVHRFLCMFVLI